MSVRSASLPFLVPLVALLAGCASKPACKADPSVVCVGPAGCAGSEACTKDGVLQCVCVAADAGVDAGTDGGALQDAGTDAGVCDLIAQTGCGLAERCTFAIAGPDAGEVRCLADGTLGLDAPCQARADNFDDCQKGLTCAAGSCLSLCPLGGDGSSCASQHACLPSIVNPPASACAPLCDPVTQVRLSDNAPACGSPDGGPITRGCYGSPGTPFICLPAGPAQNTSDVVLSGSAVPLSACAPGFEPMLLASTGSTDLICVAFCRPAPTNTTHPENAAGAPDSGYTCADRGATGTHECRYYWWLQDGLFDGTSNTVGFCEDYTRYQYDSDNNGTPDTPNPSCTQLSSTAHTFDPTLSDDQVWGCVPYSP